MRMILLPLAACSSLAACAATDLLATGPLSTSSDSMTQPDAAPPFQAAVERQMAAVLARDYDTVVDTITGGRDLLLIFPDGTMTRTREEYLSFHREWFADADWVMTAEPIKFQVDGSYGHALYRMSFDGDGAGPKAAGMSLLSLGFRLEDGSWRLVHDQNTRIAAP